MSDPSLHSPQSGGGVDTVIVGVLVDPVVPWLVVGSGTLVVDHGSSVVVSMVVSSWANATDKKFPVVSSITPTTVKSLNCFIFSL